ncbi:MAG: hypothetical protein M1423_06990 [Acidobacteria bacterium]|nr:hypothetical protein [Acidobacteriota bacterium]
MGIGSGWERHGPPAARPEGRDGEAIEMSDFLFKGQEAEKKEFFFSKTKLGSY